MSQRYCTFTWVIWACLAKPTNTKLSTCKRLSCLSAFITDFFFKMSQRYHKFMWVIWVCLAKPTKTELFNFITQFFLKILKRHCILVILSTLCIPGHTSLVCLALPIKIDGINLYDSLMFICKQKINFIPSIFFEIMQRSYKLVILGTLGMTGYDQYKRYYQLVENFDIYLHAKNDIYSSPVS